MFTTKFINRLMLLIVLVTLAGCWKKNSNSEVNDLELENDRACPTFKKENDSNNLYSNFRMNDKLVELRVYGGDHSENSSKESDRLWNGDYILEEEVVTDLGVLWTGNYYEGRVSNPGVFFTPRKQGKLPKSWLIAEGPYSRLVQNNKQVFSWFNKRDSHGISASILTIFEENTSAFEPKQTNKYFGRSISDVEQIDSINVITGITYKKEKGYAKIFNGDFLECYL